MEAHDQDAREVIDLAITWAKDRAETRAAIGAVLDSVVTHTPDGSAVAVINPELVADLRRRSGT